MNEIHKSKLICNYYGYLVAKRIKGKPYMSLEDVSGYRWVPISEELYEAFVKHLGTEPEIPHLDIINDKYG